MKGGADLRKLVKNFFKSTVKDCVLQHFNYEGLKGKASFSGLTLCKSMKSNLFPLFLLSL